MEILWNGSVPVLDWAQRMYLWCVHQIHFQQACLQWSFHGSVILQGIKEEGCALLDQVVFHEHINNLEKQKRNLIRDVKLLYLWNAT